MKKILTIFLTLIFIAQLGYCGIDFDAVDDVINCGTSDALLPENGAATISVWINPDSSGEGALGRIIQRRGVILLTIDTSTVRFSVGGSTDLLRLASNNSITFGTFQHILVTWDGSTTAANVHIYVNGSEVSYATTQNGASPTNNATYPTFIGNDSTSVRTFDGIITELAVWNVVLSANQIALLASSRLKGMPLLLADPDADGTQELVAYWPLDEGTHGNSADLDTAWDMSGNGNNGNPDNGADNLGMLWSAETILDYPSPIIQ